MPELAPIIQTTRPLAPETEETKVEETESEETESEATEAKEMGTPETEKPGLQALRAHDHHLVNLHIVDRVGYAASA